MEFLNGIQEWFINFFGVRQLLDVFHSGDYSKLLTKDGILWLVQPLFPVLLVLEIIKAAIFRKFKAVDYKIPFFSYVLNGFIGRFLSIGMVILCIGLFEKYALFQTTLTWYWFIYG